MHSFKLVKVPICILAGISSAAIKSRMPWFTDQMNMTESTECFCLFQNVARLHLEKSLADSTISELREKVQKLEVQLYM